MNHICAEIKCPFFTSETERSISCEGAEIDIKNTMRFRDGNQKMSYIQRFCTKYPNNCLFLIKQRVLPSKYRRPLCRMIRLIILDYLLVHRVCFEKRNVIMELLGIVSFAAIVVICYALGEIIKITPLDNKFIQAMLFVTGAILRAVAFLTGIPKFPAGDMFLWLILFYCCIIKKI